MMKENLEVLKRQFGSDAEVAKRLGITARHVRNIRQGYHVSLSLQKLIAMMAGVFESDKDSKSL